MKKVVLFILGITAMCSVNAQFTTGQKLIGPSLGVFLNNNSNENNFTTIGATENKSNNLVLNAGISLIKMKTSKKGNGFVFNYNFSHTKYDYQYNNITPNENNVNINNTHDFSIGFFQRNFIQIKPKFYFFYDAGVATSLGLGNMKYSSSTSSNTNRESELNSLGGKIYLTPGFSYFIRRNLLLEASMNNLAALGYSLRTEKYKNVVGANKNTSSSFNATSSLSANGLLNSFSFSIKWIR
jgi:hypothetical protein